MLHLPVVTEDFDGRCAAIDAAIRNAAENFKFSYSAPIQGFDEGDRIADIVYKISDHYRYRGFLVRYHGEDGLLTISWQFPTMGWQDIRNFTRTSPTMIPHLGLSFTAALLYLCMTNGTDMRVHTNVTIQRQLNRMIQDAATLGNTAVQFGFPEVPAPSVLELFKETFEALQTVGFTLTYNANTNLFNIKWGTTMTMVGATGEGITFDIV